MKLTERFSRAYDTFIGRQDQYEKELDKKIQQIKRGTYFTQNIEGVAAVHTCAKVLGESIGRVSLDIYRLDENGHRIKDTNDYRYDMLHNMWNNYLTSNQGFTTVEYTRNIKGNGFARIKRNDNTGIPEQLSLISPEQVTGYKVQDGELYYKVDGFSEPINSNDILHFRLITKNDGIWGLNPLESLRLNLSLTNQALNKLNEYYINNLMTTKILKSNMPNVSTKNIQETIDNLTEQLNQNSGKIISIPTNFDIEELALSFADNIFIDTIKFNTSQVASIYGCPPYLVGLYEQSKFNNVEQLGLQFRQQTLSAIFKMYEQELMAKLLTKEERLAGVQIKFNIDQIIEYDYNTKINGMKSLFGMGVVSPDFMQDFFGIDDIFTEEEKEIMKKHFLMTNITTMENIDKIQPIKPMETPSETEEEPTDEQTEEPTREMKVQIKVSDIEEVLKKQRGRPKKQF